MRTGTIALPKKRLRTQFFGMTSKLACLRHKSTRDGENQEQIAHLSEAVELAPKTTYFKWHSASFILNMRLLTRELKQAAFV
jgi:hypothetical protein